MITVSGRLTRQIFYTSVKYLRKVANLVRNDALAGALGITDTYTHTHIQAS